MLYNVGLLVVFISVSFLVVFVCFIFMFALSSILKLLESCYINEVNNIASVTFNTLHFIGINFVFLLK